ncbi:MAG: hypothetical protein JWR08_745 [Enterovirga sp.]|nr:hypothetical protein [Enterovirga sp.]
MLRPVLLALRLVLTAAVLAWLLPAGTATAGHAAGSVLQAGVPQSTASVPKAPSPASEAPLVATLAIEDGGDSGDDGCSPLGACPAGFGPAVGRPERRAGETWRERHGAGAHMATGPPSPP